MKHFLVFECPSSGLTDVLEFQTRKDAEAIDHIHSPGAPGDVMVTYVAAQTREDALEHYRGWYDTGAV